jgi:phospholipase C
MGHYDTRALPIYAYLHGRHHPKYVIADRFFQSAFGGSFLNHQYLVAARAPIWKNPPTSGGTDMHSVLDSAGFPNKGYPLYAPQSGASYNDGALTQACPADPGHDNAGYPVDGNGRACGDYAVNTVQPANVPSGALNADGSVKDPSKPPMPLINDTDPNGSNFETNIGDELSAKNVPWAWYAGGWDDANAGHPDPLFQYHHQPFNYFANYAKGKPGREHLKDEKNFMDSAKNGSLPAVSFVKPIGEENEHPGYASTDNGESHLVDLLKTIESGPQADSTLVVVTYDEFGGQWDHVSPPGQGNNNGPHDSYGPGTRIPALVLGKPVQRSGVDSTSYDTTSILRLIEQRFGLSSMAYRDDHVNSLGDAVTAKP